MANCTDEAYSLVESNRERERAVVVVKDEGRRVLKEARFQSR